MRLGGAQSRSSKIYYNNVINNHLLVRKKMYRETNHAAEPHQHLEYIIIQL